MLSPALLAKLVCPVSKKQMIYFAAENQLVCPASKLAYRIVDEVPQLIAEEAQKLSEGEIATAIARARTLGLPIPT